MAYKQHLGAIPGYDAITQYKAKKQRQKDWQKNVGSKGRRIVYADRRPDYGATSTAFSQMTSSLNATMGSAMLPFAPSKFVKHFRKSAKKKKRYFR